MVRIALADAWSRKRRLAGTALAVVLAVTFLTATLVLSATLEAGFASAFAEANEGTDAVVRSELQLRGEQASASSFDAGVVDAIRSVDGVRAVAAQVEGRAQIVAADGTVIGGNGPPAVGAAWVADPRLNGFDLDEGRAPARAGEVVIDRGSAKAGGLRLAGRVTVLTPSPVEATVVGIARFGESDSLGASTLAAFTLDQAQQLFVGGHPRLTQIAVAGADGVGQHELVRRITAVVPEGVEVISGEQLVAEQEAAIRDDFLGFVKTALLAFSGVALLVAAFSIFNTFSILGAQRTREAALLRTIGASRRQILAGGLVEAVIVGVSGAVVGSATGIGAAAGLLSLLKATGFGLPARSLEVVPTDVSAAVLVGLVVTVVGALIPAWRASRVAPLAALREVAYEAAPMSSVRALLGAVLAAGAVAAVVAGTVGDGAMPLVGLGGTAGLVASVLLGPIVARPVAGLLGAPLRWRGVAGDLARRNAIRNPRRTAATATSLLVGVGVVTLFTVLASSMGASLEDAVDRSFGGDLVVEGSGFSGAGLAPAFLDDVRSLPEVRQAAGIGFGAVVIDGKTVAVGFADVNELASVATFELAAGDMADFGPAAFAVSEEAAAERGWSVGQEVAVTFADGGTERLRLAAVYEDRAMGGPVLLPTSVWARHAGQPTYVLMLVDLADGVSIAEGRAAVGAAAKPYGRPAVRDRDAFVASQAAQIRGVLNVVYGLLAIAVLIALMGIANTLSLSVYERTHELGLLRAVGQSRSQLRAMVRWESVVVALFGAVGGVAVGVFAGWGLVGALRASEGLGTFVLPGSLAAVVGLGALAGVLAGVRPARRAARLDVLAAISTA